MENIFKFMNNAVFGKLMEDMTRHRNIKVVTTERRKNYLISKPNYHTTKYLTEDLLPIEMKRLKY